MADRQLGGSGNFLWWSLRFHDQWRHTNRISVCNSGPGVLHRIDLVDAHTLRGTIKGVGAWWTLFSLRGPRYAVRWSPQTSRTTHAERQLGMAGRDSSLPLVLPLLSAFQWRRFGSYRCMKHQSFFSSLKGSLATI